MKKNLLIVEDHELTRFGLKTAFEACDFVESIYEAESAEKGIDIATNNEINLIIMDLGLPGMDGIEATKQITSFDPEAKIIMVSAMGQMVKVCEAIDAGAKDFIVKPFEPERIIECISKYME